MQKHYRALRGTVKRAAAWQSRLKPRIRSAEMQLRHADVVIAGGGLAGSLAAAMLGRAGIDAVLVDPRPVYPPDFRCEKPDRQHRNCKRCG